MIRRSTWVIILLFAISLVALWFLREREAQEASSATPAATPAMVFTASTASPVGLRLTSAGGQVLELLDKGVDGWQIVEPALGAADATQVTSLISSLLSLQVAGTLDPVPSDADMGLVDPAYTIQLTWLDGQVHVLSVGAQTPTSSRYYARLDDGQAVLISLYSLADVKSMLQTPPVLATATSESTPELMIETPGAAVEATVQSP